MACDDPSLEILSLVVLTARQHGDLLSLLKEVNLMLVFPMNRTGALVRKVYLQSRHLHMLVGLIPEQTGA